MIGGVAVLLVLMLVSPMLKPSPSASPGSNPPSITVDQAYGSRIDSNSNSSSNTIATTNGQVPVTETAPFSLGGGEVFSLIWRLGLVLLVLGVCIVGLRWWSKRAAGPRSMTGYLRIVDTLPIQGGRSVHLVAVGERVIVVGATAQQLSYLAELKDEEASDLLAEREVTEQQSVSAFAVQLFQSLRRDDRMAPGQESHAAREYE